MISLLKNINLKIDYTKIKLKKGLKKINKNAFYLFFKNKFNLNLKLSNDFKLENNLSSQLIIKNNLLNKYNLKNELFIFILNQENYLKILKKFILKNENLLFLSYDKQIYNLLNKNKNIKFLNNFISKKNLLIIKILTNFLFYKIIIFKNFNKLFYNKILYLNYILKNNVKKI